MIPNRFLVMGAGAGSAALLLGALAFQFIGGLSPCPLCIWQRWPHVATVLLAILALTLLQRHLRLVAIGAALAMLTGALLGVYHTGIERGWWPGPDTCTSSDIRNLSTDQLMTQILNAPLVRCDEVVWDMFGLSMASWNALASLALALCWLVVAVRGNGRQDSSSASQ